MNIKIPAALFLSEKYFSILLIVFMIASFGPARDAFAQFEGADVYGGEGQSQEQDEDNGRSDVENVHTLKEVQAQISLVEKELEGVKNSKAKEIADSEISSIEKSIKNAKKLLEEKEYDLAFYEINIAQGYFSKIEARMELYYSKQVYDQVKSKLNK